MKRRGRHWKALAIAAMLLSACSGGGLFGARGSGSTAESDTAAPIKTVQVMSKSVAIAGPRGFCVDAASSRDTRASAFVVLGSCAALSPAPRATAPRQPALLTATVAPAPEAVDEAALDEMAAYFATDEGSAALARDGAETAAADVDRAPGLVLAHVHDGVTTGATQSDYWRGVFPVAGRVVSVTVSGYAVEPLGVEDGAALARAFVEAIRDANAGDGAPGRGGGLLGVLNGLLR